jgi:adenylate cyclase
MAVEIERKFLLGSDAWRTAASHCESIAQGYLTGPPASRCSVRVRRTDERAFLNIKSLANGIARDEFEYAIPTDDARRMLTAFAGDLVTKRRHHVEIGAHLFEIDEFEGDNAGLMVAEIELAAIDEAFPRPDWLGAEVSHLARYYNTSLAMRPYRLWTVAERDALDAQ